MEYNNKTKMNSEMYMGYKVNFYKNAEGPAEKAVLAMAMMSPERKGFDMQSYGPDKPMAFSRLKKKMHSYKEMMRKKMSMKAHSKKGKDDNPLLKLAKGW